MTAEEGALYMTIDGEQNNLLVVSRPGLVFMNLVNKRAISATDAGDGPVWVSVTGER
jgi:hypothetical protein